jgi:sugar-specific transcriptional regulator TrmB
MKKEDLTVFTNLGLTIRQAQVYLAIATLGHAKVATMAKKVQADRAEIYRALPKLEQLGLVQRQLTTPLIFKAVTISEAFRILLKLDAKRHYEFKADAKQFVKNFDEQPLESPEEPQYRITLGEKAEVREYIKDIVQTQSSKDSIFAWNPMVYVLNKYADFHVKTLKRGVRYRYITQVPKDAKMPQIIQALMETGHLEIKSVLKDPKVGISIFDRSNVNIVIFPSSSRKEMQVLRSNNSDLVDSLQDYFEIKWRSAAMPFWHETPKVEKSINKNL